ATPGRAELVDALLATCAELWRARDEHVADVRVRIDDYAAALIAAFVPRYVRHFRLFLPPLLVGSLCSVLMTSLYFIEPQRLIASLIFVWVAGIVSLVAMVYLSLDRDPVISAIGHTTANEVTFNWGLVRRGFSWILVPLASLLAAQYPEFAFRVSTFF